MFLGKFYWENKYISNFFIDSIENSTGTLLITMRKEDLDNFLNNKELHKHLPGYTTYKLIYGEDYVGSANYLYYFIASYDLKKVLYFSRDRATSFLIDVTNNKKLVNKLKKLGDLHEKFRL